ncbi:MAG TPA: hypothetical protein PLB19_01350 [Candidatus Paceibacterota bacterium]|nr:hypothetical protein [Candidatus Paceibacterota bacterium]HPQ22930.1 hypothetical protein [Candidatus Paceibacterota bacterium]
MSKKITIFVIIIVLLATGGVFCGGEKAREVTNQQLAENSSPLKFVNL